MQAEILIPTSNMSEAEWLEHRQKALADQMLVPLLD